MEASKVQEMGRPQIITQLRDILEPWVSDSDLIKSADERTNLVADLGLDSVGILQVVLGVEKEFGITIANHELDSELLSMMGNLAKMIEEKLNEAG